MKSETSFKKISGLFRFTEDKRDGDRIYAVSCRYRQLNRLFEARDNMICQYASFVSYPLIQHCPAGNRCITFITIFSVVALCLGHQVKGFLFRLTYAKEMFVTSEQ